MSHSFEAWSTAALTTATTRPSRVSGPHSIARDPPNHCVRKLGACCCALSPCGRGQRLTFNKHGWVRGCNLTPHPTCSVETPSCPLPQGERAQQRPARL